MTLPIEVNPLLLSTLGGYTISRSVRLRSSASAYFNRTPASNGNAQKFTISFWVKIGTLGSAYANLFGAGAIGSGGGDPIYLNANTLAMYADGGGGATLITTQVFRDPSAWYHIVYAIDTTQATSSNRIKLYVNGVQVTAFSTATYPTQNYNFLNINKASVVQYIGTGFTNYFDGYLTEINFIDGQQLTPSSFGQTNSITGVWQPIKYSGTYGTNGFYLNFSDNSSNTATTIGKDYSGNGNNWTPNNISVTAGVTYDSMIDSPTVSASSSNYEVLNPLMLAGTGIDVAQGNLYANRNSSGWARIAGSIGVTSGKWYWEITPNNNTTSQMIGIGLGNTASNYPGYESNTYGFYTSTGQKYNNNTGASYGSYSAGQIVGVALDLDSGKIWFSCNGTWQASGDPAAGTNAAFTSVSGTYFPEYGLNGSSTNGYANFGQRPFSYTPPTGFNALNTFNLPTPTIANGATVMAATTFDGVTGGGTVVNTVNGIGFKPDMVWMKVRNNANNHELADSVRGTAYALFPNLTNAEVSDTRVSAFNSNGFSYGTNSNSALTGRTVVGWQWQAGQGTTSSNTNGSITSTVSVNATAGFSVVTYTGNGSTNQTVGHGLGVAPSMIIIKNRSSAIDWIVYHASIGATGFLYLNLTTATTTSSNPFNNTAPTSSVFTIAGNSSNSYVNGNGNSMLAYCFSAVAGYSAFGSYTGNGSSDGTFVYCGFRPRYVLVKITSGADNWYVHDTSRSPYNVSAARLMPNSSAAEVSDQAIDFLSNGFKLRTSDGAINGSGSTYIYAAFAENPFRNALAR